MPMSKNKLLFNSFHVVCWACLFLPIAFLVPRYSQDDTIIYLLRMVLPLNMCVMFYVNYLWLAPKYYLKKKDKLTFNSLNIFFLLLCTFITYEASVVIHQRELLLGLLPRVTHKFLSGYEIPLFMLQVILCNGISALLATLLRQSISLQLAERSNRETTIQRVEARLSNLRMQTSPHFLLNTLNNIYALIEFDQEKAQKAVSSLSNLLRKMLYGDQDTFIPLEEVTSFIEDYSDIMRLRLQDNVSVELNIDIPSPCQYKAVPFIFISLVENAFKHGIGSTEPSFIKINISANDGEICCHVENSNHPKHSNDKSGHGIGLSQVQKMLDMCYPGKYTWKKGIDKNNIYSSKITVYDTQLCNH